MIDQWGGRGQHLTGNGESTPVILSEPDNMLGQINVRSRNTKFCCNKRPVACNYSHTERV